VRIRTRPRNDLAHMAFAVHRAAMEWNVDWLINVDWKAIVVPERPLAELVVRGTIMYLAVFVMLRLVMRRQVGGLGTSDILVIVLIAEVAGNGFSPDTRSVVESAVLVLVILFWSYVIEWLQFRFPGFERIVRDPKLKLIEDGRLLRRNMRQELVTYEELMTQLREQGLENCRAVKAAYMEADGNISIIRKEELAGKG
jgi:uncharacterized membrane protein YcaP (DUF421 family)